MVGRQNPSRNDRDVGFATTLMHREEKNKKQYSEETRRDIGK